MLFLMVCVFLVCSNFTLLLDVLSQDYFFRTLKNFFTEMWQNFSRAVILFILCSQCDICLCWQHGLCNNIKKETEVPEKYVCSFCLNPIRQRKSKKFLHDQDWLKEGKLPRFVFSQWMRCIIRKCVFITVFHTFIRKDVQHNFKEFS